MFEKLLLNKEMKWCWKSAVRMLLKSRRWRVTWYLFAGFKTIILCSVHSIWFVKYVFSAKIWFVKTLTRIVKYESRVVKSNPTKDDLNCRIWYVGFSKFSKILSNLLAVWLWEWYVTAIQPILFPIDILHKILPDKLGVIFVLISTDL